MTRYEAEQRVAWLCVEIGKVLHEYRPHSSMSMIVDDEYGATVWTLKNEPNMPHIDFNLHDGHILSLNVSGRVNTFDLDKTFRAGEQNG